MTEVCCERGCAKQVVRRDGNRCGGILFGTLDNDKGPLTGCGKFFCGDHLVGHLGPYYCRACWEAAKAKPAPAPTQPPEQVTVGTHLLAQIDRLHRELFSAFEPIIREHASTVYDPVPVKREQFAKLTSVIGRMRSMLHG